MFCSECGVEAEGKFCWKCGAPLHGNPADSASIHGDWSEQVRYDLLITHPLVRDVIARHGAQAKKSLSGEDLFKLFDKLARSPVPLEMVGKIAVPLWTSVGVKSGVKTRTETIARPCGHVIVAALCSLARNGQALTGVDQADDGCTLHAEQPSDFRALQGEIRLTVRKQAGATRVEAGAWSNGQFFDWGKSRACLDRLVEDLRVLNVSV